MDFGAAMFFTDYSMTAAELGQALEARGFELVWAPEHSHIPSTRKTPPAGGGELGKQILRRDGPVRDLDRRGDGDKDVEGRDRGVPRHPARHDPDRQARRHDRPGLGRPVSVRHRRRVEPGRDREPRHRVQNPLQEDARADRGDEGDLDQVRSPNTTARSSKSPKMRTWPKPVQKPHPPVIVGGAFPHSARRAVALRRRLDAECEPGAICRRHRVFAGVPADGDGSRARSCVDPDHDLCGVPEDLDRLKRYRDQGIARVVVSLPSANRDEIMPVLDRWAGLIRQTAH